MTDMIAVMMLAIIIFTIAMIDVLVWCILAMKEKSEDKSKISRSQTFSRKRCPICKRLTQFEVLENVHVCTKCGYEWKMGRRRR